MAHHQGIGFLIGVSLGVVAPRPGVVQGGLVTSQIDRNVALNEALPEIDGISDKRDGPVAPGGLALQGRIYRRIHVFKNCIHPPLAMALVGGSAIDFGGNADHSGDGGGFGLGPAHAAQSSGDEEFAFQGAAG